MPTFVNHIEKVLEITLGNTLMNGLVKNWKASDVPSMPDHRIIRLYIDGYDGGGKSSSEPQEIMLRLQYK